MIIACLISAREYYIGYETQTKLEKELEAASLQIHGKSNQASEVDRSGASALFTQAKFNPERQQMLQVGKGDTIGSLLASLGVSPKEIEESTKTLRQAYNLKDLQIGQTILVKYHQESEMSQARLIELEFKPDISHQIILTKHKKHGFKVHKFAAVLIKKLRRVHGNISVSFYNEAHKLGVPQSIIEGAVKALSHAINFQHGIRSGDPFEVLYEVFLDSNGKIVKSGRLLYVAVAANGHPHMLYHFKSSHGDGYFNAEGASAERALLQTPLDPKKMKITSPYGVRRHPIKGYRRDHKGVDFGAHAGTHVWSAGDGIVIQAGYHNGFGNLIRIKHVDNYVTEYAHLSKILVKVGNHISQGQHIGNVGATGLATGPHLHFGLMKNGKYTNPMAIKHLPIIHLAKNDLEKFNHLKGEIDTQVIGLHFKNHFVEKDKKKKHSGKHHHSHHHHPNHHGKKH
jgi:murein DD-endopeptidase MepM/ murein hydrolase activator NlpD